MSLYLLLFLLLFFLSLLLLILLLSLYPKTIIFLKEIFFKEDRNIRLKRIKEIAKKIPVYSNVNYMSKRRFMIDIEKSLPANILTKEEIYKYLTSEYSHYYKDYIICTTSGTSGQIGIFINDKKSWIKIQAVLFSKLFYPHLFDFFPFLNITAIFVVADNGHFTTRKLAVPELKLFFVNVIIISIFDKNITEKLNSIRPQLLHMYPSHLESILDNLNISPKIITTGSEQLSKNLRRKLSTKFPKTKIIETYGCSECPLIGSSCEFGNLHLHEDVCIVEPVDEHNRIITKKYVKSNKIYITNLINEFSPIIRYEMNDCIEYIDCSCGKPSSIVVHGRQDDVLNLIDRSGKIRKHFPISIETLFVSIPYNFTYQIIHEFQNHLTVILKADDSEIINKINENLSFYFRNYDIKYRIISRPFYIEKSGKMRQIINGIHSNIQILK